MSATATSRNGHSSNPVGDGRLDHEDEDSPEGDSGGSLPGRLLKALAGQVVSRVPPADLDERDPDYIREALPRLLSHNSRDMTGRHGAAARLGEHLRTCCARPG